MSLLIDAMRCGYRMALAVLRMGLMSESHNLYTIARVPDSARPTSSGATGARGGNAEPLKPRPRYYFTLGASNAAGRGVGMTSLRFSTRMLRAGISEPNPAVNRRTIPVDIESGQSNNARQRVLSVMRFP